MKRLVNKYSAFDVYNVDANEIRFIIEEATERVLDFVKSNDICPRDAESLCHSELSTLFSEYILRSAMELKRKEDSTFGLCLDKESVQNNTPDTERLKWPHCHCNIYGSHWCVEVCEPENKERKKGIIHV